MENEFTKYTFSIIIILTRIVCSPHMALTQTAFSMLIMCVFWFQCQQRPNPRTIVSAPSRDTIGVRCAAIIIGLHILYALYIIVECFSCASMEQTHTMRAGPHLTLGRLWALDRETFDRILRIEICLYHRKIYK